MQREMSSNDTPLVNSSSPVAAYMRQRIRSALVQIMVVAYSAPGHCLNQCWDIVDWNPRNKFQRNLNLTIKLFIHENASENIVCEMTAILSRGEDELTREVPWQYARWFRMKSCERYSLREITNFKTIGKLRHKLTADEISPDLS